jgi:hypothetical protein
MIYDLGSKYSHDSSKSSHRPIVISSPRPSSIIPSEGNFQHQDLSFPPDFYWNRLSFIKRR